MSPDADAACCRFAATAYAIRYAMLSDDDTLIRYAISPLLRCAFYAPRFSMSLRHCRR